MIDTLLFDLDGTITDPKEGITKSVAYALAKFNIQILNLDELDVFIGPPLKESFMLYYHMDDQQATQAIAYYREYFKEKGMFENMPYEGIQELLEELNSAGYQCYIATSKPETFSIQILKHFCLDRYFKDVCGATMDGSRSEKKDVIAYAIKKHKLQFDNCLMIGDRKHDVLGALSNNISSIGVLYGYGSYDELIEAKAKHIVSDLSELKQCILQYH